MPKPNGTVKLIVGILAFAAICVGWGIAWGSINKDVEVNTGHIADNKTVILKIDDKLDKLIIGQTALQTILAARIDDKHN